MIAHILFIKRKNLTGLQKYHMRMVAKDCLLSHRHLRSWDGCRLVAVDSQILSDTLIVGSEYHKQREEDERTREETFGNDGRRRWRVDGHELLLNHQK